MSKRYYGLPSLTTLAAFEACARHLSFKHAAAELNVTPGAVSHQIKALEKEIGVALFERLHRGVKLTPAGAELFAVLAASFSQTASVLEKISAGPGDFMITIGTSAAVASLWLMPRLGRLLQAHPELRINHRVADRRVDLEQSDFDLVVRYGNGHWDGEKSVQLFMDSVGPVCSPEFARTHSIKSIAELTSLPLLQLESIDTGWLPWNEWFALNGVSVARISGAKFNNYSIALQAAEEGAGVILGWSRLIESYLLSRRLVPLGDFFVPAPGAFYLTWSSRKALDPSVALVRDWLVKAV